MLANNRAGEYLTSLGLKLSHFSKMIPNVFTAIRRISFIQLDNGIATCSDLERVKDWWKSHYVGTYSTLIAFVRGIYWLPVDTKLEVQVTYSCGSFFVVSLNKTLNIKSFDWLHDTLQHSCNVTQISLAALLPHEIALIEAQGITTMVL